jgi:hypothetical protein
MYIITEFGYFVNYLADGFCWLFASSLSVIQKPYLRQYHQSQTLAPIAPNITNAKMATGIAAKIQRIMFKV